LTRKTRNESPASTKRYIETTAAVWRDEAESPGYRHGDRDDTEELSKGRI